MSPLAYYDFASASWARFGAGAAPPVGVAPSIVTSSLGTMTAGVSFSQTIAYTGDPVIGADITSGALPSGLSIVVLLGVVTITGTPVSTGSYSMTLRVTNPYGSGTRSFSGTVGASGGALWPSDLFAARDFAALDAWYAANTGPLTEPTLELPGDNIDTDWLWANDDGEHVYEDGGNWYVQNIATHNFGIVAPNVRIRNCDINPVEGWYGLNTPYGQNPTGLVVENTKIHGGGDWQSFLFPAATEPGQLVFRRCDISGFRTGAQIIGGVTAEENWIHDLYYGPGDPHVTAMSIRSRNVTARRNRIADGNSAGLAFYNENSPYTNILVEQNVISTENSTYEVAYTGSHPPGANSVRFINNLLDRGAFTGGHNFSEVSGNVNRAGNLVT